jgi:dTDP-4-amino-4,6-dideoxygalactose transaminase
MNYNTRIPVVDLVSDHREQASELMSVFKDALNTAGFVGGPMVEGFEKSFAEFCGTEYCVGVSSGTDALRFALIAAGIGAGDTVITVPNTFIATTEGISQAGAVPEFVDIDERTYTMDPAKLQGYIEQRCQRHFNNGQLICNRTGKRVAAIVPVHLYGQMADMDAILALAETYRLVVVEDACQAHGAEYFSKKLNRWVKAGSLGRAAAFSFYPGKNLGACGEAGAVTTNDVELARSVMMLRDHGQAQKYYHDIEGYNGRLDAIQAGILNTKLSHLQEWNRNRREHASLYTRLFQEANTSVVAPHEPHYCASVYHLYVVRCVDRGGLRANLTEANIGTGIHYPVPLHLQKAYRPLGYSVGAFPVAERTAAEILSLPMHPRLRCEQIEQVVSEVTNFASKRRSALVTSP